MHSVCKRGCVGKKDLRFQIPSVGALITPNQLAWVFSKRTERGRNCSGRKSQTCFGSICLSHRQPVRHVRCRKTPDARRKTQGARHLCSRIHIRPDTCKKINVPVLRSLCCYVLLHLHTTLMYHLPPGRITRSHPFIPLMRHPGFRSSADCIVCLPSLPPNSVWVGRLPTKQLEIAQYGNWAKS